MSLLSRFVFLASFALSTGALAQKNSSTPRVIKFSEWEAKLSKSFVSKQITRLEGLLALYVPNESEVQMMYAIFHLDRSQGRMRADFIQRTREHQAFIYQDSALQIFDVEQPLLALEWKARSNTYNDLVLQVIKLLLGQKLEGGLLSEEKHRWTYLFKPYQQELSATPVHPDFNMQKLTIGLDANEKIQMLKMMSRDLKSGIVLDVKVRGQVFPKNEIWTRTYKVDPRVAFKILKNLES